MLHLLPSQVPTEIQLKVSVMKAIEGEARRIVVWPIMKFKMLVPMVNAIFMIFAQNVIVTHLIFGSVNILNGKLDMLLNIWSMLHLVLSNPNLSAPMKMFNTMMFTKISTTKIFFTSIAFRAICTVIPLWTLFWRCPYEMQLNKQLPTFRSDLQWDYSVTNTLTHLFGLIFDNIVTPPKMSF